MFEFVLSFVHILAKTNLREIYRHLLAVYLSFNFRIAIFGLVHQVSYIDILLLIRIKQIQTIDCLFHSLFLLLPYFIFSYKCVSNDIVRRIDWFISLSLSFIPKDILL